MTKIDTALQVQCPNLTSYWKFPTKKAGWTWIDSENKRVLLYRQPCKSFFKATLVLGEKAVRDVLATQQLSPTLK